MAPYHVVMVHFPIALWMTATLAILLCAFSDGQLAKAVGRALVPLLSISLVWHRRVFHWSVGVAMGNNFVNAARAQPRADCELDCDLLGSNPVCAMAPR